MMSSKLSSEGQNKQTEQGDFLAPTPAVVRINGELLDQLPQDLFIPPEALEVFLDSFQGPLDLLIYLIRKQNIDILDIPIAQITVQYMKYVELMQKIRLDLAAEYLVMAAMLAQIKSRMLLPRQEAQVDIEEEDPRAALIRQLQQYEQFASAAQEIDKLPRVERDIFLRQTEFKSSQTKAMLPQANMNDLMLAFRRVMHRAQQNQGLIIKRQTLSMREKMTHILDRLQSDKHLRFEQLFTETEGREGVVVSFIAILELMRDGLISIVQGEAFSPIHVKATV